MNVKEKYVWITFVNIQHACLPAGRQGIRYKQYSTGCRCLLDVAYFVILTDLRHCEELARRGNPATVDWLVVNVCQLDTGLLRYVARNDVGVVVRVMVYTPTSYTTKNSMIPPV